MPVGEAIAEFVIRPVGFFAFRINCKFREIKEKNRG